MFSIIILMELNFMNDEFDIYVRDMSIADIFRKD